MLYSLYVTGFFLAKIMPIGVCYFVAELVARTYFLFAERDKEGLRANLKVVLGGDADEATINRHVLAVFRNFAKYLADFFKFTRFSEEYVFRNIEIVGREHVDKCLSEGKGVITLSLHLGNWELGGAVVGGLNYPISALILEHANKRINDFFTRQRAINDMKAIPVGLRIKECFNVLKRGEILAIAGDKDYTASGIYVDFFGKKALMPKGPAVFSLRTGAPIVFSVLTREKGDRFKLTFEKPIKYHPIGDHEKDIRALMSEYLRIFERYVREYPDQWYAFRKVWNQE